MKQWVIFSIICLVLIIVSYFYLDRAIVEYAYQHHYRDYKILDYFTHIPEIFMVLAPVMIVLVASLKLIRGQLASYHYSLLLMSITLLTTEKLKAGLKFVFARYWPATWINDNPSWLRDQVYGFHWFDGNVWYASFPSGHTALTFACMSVVFCLYPKLRLLAGLVCAMVLLGLLGNYYHFLSDMIAGAYLGTVCGCLAVKYYRSYQTIECT